MWTFVSLPERRNVEREGGWSYVLSCEAQQLAYSDEPFVQRMQAARVALIIHDQIDGRRWIADNRWDEAGLEAEGKFTTEHGSAWAQFSKSPDTIYVSVVLGRENEVAFGNDLEHLLMTDRLLLYATLDIWLSKLSGAGPPLAVTYGDFLVGEPAFSRTPVTHSNVRKHP